MAALAVPLAVGAGWLAFSGDDVLGEMELRGFGTVSVIRGGETLEVNDTFGLEIGDVVTTGAHGTARFNLTGDRSLELADASAVRILGEAAVAAEDGSLFAETGDATRLAVGDVTVNAPNEDAIFRVDRASAVRVGVYSGAVSVAAPGEGSLRIGRFYEASVPIAAPDIPFRPDPYRLDANDNWDESNLRSVIDLDQQLTTTADGLAAQFGRDKLDLEYFRAVAGENVGFMKPFLKHRAADLLIALTVARGASIKSLAAAFGKTMDLFDRGARWGITAAIMRAKPRSLVKSLGALIEKSGLGGGNGGAPAAAILIDSQSDEGRGDVGDEGNANAPTDAPTDAPTADPTDDPTDPAPDPTPTGDPTPKPTDPPKECTSDLECTIQDIEPPVDNPLDDELGKKLGGSGGGGGGSSSDSGVDLPDIP